MVCVHACVRACVRACVCVCERERVCVYVLMSMLLALCRLACSQQPARAPPQEPPWQDALVVAVTGDGDAKQTLKYGGTLLNDRPMVQFERVSHVRWSLIIGAETYGCMIIHCFGSQEISLGLKVFV